MKHLSIFVFMLILSIDSSQAARTILFRDGNTNEAMAFANIEIYKNCAADSTTVPEYITTDDKGKIVLDFEQTFCISFSYLGYPEKRYKILSDTLITVYQEPKLMKEITITGTFTPTPIKDALYDVKVLSNELLNTKGSTNLRDALNTELLFKTNNGHVNETALTINGLSGNHVKYMVDGVPVEGRLNGNIDISQLNINSIERIEIIEGPSSVAYGTNALGGAINIITKKNLSKKWNLNASAYYESVGQYNFSISGGYRFKGNTFSLNFGRNFFSGYSTYDTARAKIWKPREQYFGSLSYLKNIKRLQFTYILDGFYEKMWSRGELNPPYFISAFDTYYKTMRVNNKILLTGKIAKDKAIDAVLAYSYFSRIRNIYFKDLTTLTYYPTDGESDQDTTFYNALLMRGVFAQNFDSLHLNYKVGLEFKNDFILAQRVYNKRQHIGDYAAFASLEYKPIKALILNPAMRMTYNTAYKFSIMPSFHVLYKWHPDWKIKLSYARGYRAPDLKELYLEFHYNSTINLFGNTSLKPETSNHFNATLEFNKEKKLHQIIISEKFYFSKIKNLIGLDQTSPINWKYENSDYYTLYGSNFSAQYTYTFFTLMAAYNVNATYNAQFNKSGFNNHYFYNHNAVASMTFNYEKFGITANIDYKYSGKIESYYINDANEIKDSYIGAYHLLNCSAGKTFWKKKINIVMGIKNLLNSTSVNSSGDVANVSNQSDAKVLNILWGRTFFMSLTINL